MVNGVPRDVPRPKTRGAAGYLKYARLPKNLRNVRENHHLVKTIVVAVCSWCSLTAVCLGTV